MADKGISYRFLYLYYRFILDLNLYLTLIIDYLVILFVMWLLIHLNFNQIVLSYVISIS